MADRYWVGGDGNWNDTGHWSATSGGTSGASVPSASDNAIFDSLSNATGYTVTFNATATALDFTVGDPASGHVTFAGSSNLTCSGNFQLATGTVWGQSGSLIFNATSGTKTITTNGVTLDCALSINGVGGTFQFVGAFTLNQRGITLTNGTLDTNDVDVSVISFSSSNSNTRTIDLGASHFIITNGDWNCSTATNLTVTAGTSHIDMFGGDFLGGGKTYYNVTQTIIDPELLQGANTFNNYTLLNTIGAGMDAELQVNADQTINGTFTSTGLSGANQMNIVSSVIGTARTFTAAAVSLTDTNIRDMIGAGAATWTGTRLGDLQGNTNITFTTPVTRYWVGNGGNWSDDAGVHWSATSGGTAGATRPLPQDTAIFDANSFSSGSQTVLVDAIHACGFTASGVTNSPNISLCQSPVGRTTFYSSVNATGFTWVNSGTVRWANRTSVTFNPGTTEPGYSFVLEAVGGTVQLTGNYNTPSGNYRPLTIANGTLDLNGNTTTFSAVTNSSGLTRALTMGSGTMILQSTGTVWNPTLTNFTLSAASGTFEIANTTSTSKTFAGAGLTYGTLKFSGDNITLTGSNTIGTLAVYNAGLTNGLKITSATTQTVTNVTTNGSAGNLAKLLAVTAGSAAILTSSTTTISVDYMSIKDSNATGTAAWYAGANSTDVSGNSGWIFTAPPSPATAKSSSPTLSKAGLLNLQRV